MPVITWWTCPWLTCASHRLIAVFGKLLGAWLDQSFDVIAHGPFFQKHEDGALLHAVPEDVVPRRILLHCTIEVALQRLEADPDRVLSSYPDFLKSTYDRVEQLLPAMPQSEWTFDTTTTDARSIIDDLAEKLLG